MIPAVAQSLAEILTGNASSIATEQIDFDHPTVDRGIGSRLNLYFYELRPNPQRQSSSQDPEKTSQESEAILWFDLSFVITAWDATAISEQHLLSEALKMLSSHHCLPQKFLPIGLRDSMMIPIDISALGSSQTIALWNALGVPLRPALYVTVTIPMPVPTDVSSSVGKSRLATLAIN
jgi:Pvc16 N-terminal domain